MARFVAVGAGRMGRGIAIAFAYAGHSVDLVDLRTRSSEDLERLKREVEDEISAGLNGLAKLEAMPLDWVPIVARRVRFVERHAAANAIAEAEMVFEGVPETLEAKQDAFEFISRHASPQAIITSTTSSILVTQLCGMVREPRRFLNMHWLNPAYIIPVVELSQHPGTDPAVLARTKSLMESIGKVPVVCGATPGYIVPRLQALMMNEAARMVEEGAATAEDIDKATRYGLGLRFAAIGVVEFIQAVK
jgi:3-hydroxybutyryl-CoA dehydrogenase